MYGMLMMALILAGAVLVLAGGMRWLDRSRRPVEGAGVAPETLERIEAALGALESRVDALQDQQRFLERLLAERPAGGEGAGESRLPPGGGADAGAAGGESVLFEGTSDEEDG